MRTEQPATCYHCGADVEPDPRFGAESTCDDCRRTVGQPDPWVLVYGTPAPFTFERDGRTHICSWHSGHDKMHPANRGANHSACDPCLAKMNAEFTA